MIDSEVRRAIKEEIARHMNVILSGSAGATTETTEDIDAMYPGMASIPERPVMHPFGISSRAPKGTISVVARMGDHPGNRLTLGHRDAARPTVAEGEVKVYNASGQLIHLKKSAIDLIGALIHIGSAGSSQPLVLGTELQTLLAGILSELKTLASQLNTVATDLSTHMHPTAAPGPPSPPVTAAIYVTAAASFLSSGSSFDSLKASPVQDGGILSNKAFTEKG